MVKVNLPFIATLVLFALREAFAGGSSPFLDGAIATNSIFCDATIEDGVVVSHSATDTHLSLTPPSAIEDFAPGMLVLSVTAIADCSNVVSVLFGDCADPALTVECDGGWRIRPPRNFRDLGDAPTATALSTNTLSFSLRLSRQGNARVAKCSALRDGQPAALAPAALPTTFRLDDGHLPQNWDGVAVLIAGPRARLLNLAARYYRDGTRMEVK